MSEFSRGIRGAVVRPEDAEYESARPRVQRRYRSKTSVDCQCAGAADVVHCVNYARENKLLIAVRGGGHSAPDSGTWRRRHRHRFVADEKRSSGPGAPYREGGRRVHLGRCRPRHPSVRTGHSRRHHLHHGSGRPHHRRRIWVPLAPLRTRLRQPDFRGRRDGRRADPHGECRSERRSFLGHPRRRRQLRNRCLP